MEKKVLIPLAAVILILLIASFVTNKFPGLKIPISSPKIEVQQKLASIANKKINLEIANTESLRQKGLGDRTSLDIESGMLFVFDSKPVMANFWMKDMLMPIDIIWIRDEKIVKIDKNVPFYPKGTPDNQLKIYSSISPIDYVLEVNSGFSDANNFKMGDVVTLPNL